MGNHQPSTMASPLLGFSVYEKLKTSVMQEQKEETLSSIWPLLIGCWLVRDQLSSPYPNTNFPLRPSTKDPPMNSIAESHNCLKSIDQFRSTVLKRHMLQVHLAVACNGASARCYVFCGGRFIGESVESLSQEWSINTNVKIGKWCAGSLHPGNDLRVLAFIIRCIRVIGSWCLKQVSGACSVTARKYAWKLQFSKPGALAASENEFDQADRILHLKVGVIVYKVSRVLNFFYGRLLGRFIVTKQTTTSLSLTGKTIGG